MDLNSQSFVQGIDKKAWAHGWIWSVVSHAIVVTPLVMSVHSIPVAQETFQWNVEIVSNGASATQPSKETAETSLREDSNRTATPASKKSSSLASRSKEPALKSSALREMREPQHAEVSTSQSEVAAPPSGSVLSRQSASEPQVATAPSDPSRFDSNERRPLADPTQNPETASAPPQDTVLNERPVPASRSLSVGDVKRPDYGWLAAALRTRIEEIKRYSDQARSNGWEGRVVVATTVQADGHLMDIRVVESSGNGSLDEDAKQILRDTSPLVLSQPLEGAQVTVKVPIVFGLH